MRAIVALATPDLAAERAILRLSGPTLLAEGAPWWLACGGIGALGEERAVRSLAWEWMPELRVPLEAWVFPGPASATGEDVVELHLPGSRPVVAALRERLLGCRGLRAAEPGEFTRRAFLHGKLDLVQAEAVLDLVHARGAQEARAAAAVLAGALGGALADARQALTEALVQVEAGLDFEEGDSQDLQPGEIAEALARAGDALDRGRSGEDARARTAAEGFRIGLVGAPNAGKTALFSRLTGSEALVAGEAGTTRDRLEAVWQPAGLAGDGPPWLLADGPGRASRAVDARDEAAQRRARADRFDLVWYVVDGADPEAELPGRVASAEAIVVFTKTDRGRAVAESVVRAAEERGPAVWVSAEAGTGLDALVAATAGAARAADEDRAAAARAGARHRAALAQAAEAVAAARALDAEAGPQDLIAEELRTALGALAELVGAFTPEDLLDRVFADFCIGK